LAEHVYEAGRDDEAARFNRASRARVSTDATDAHDAFAAKPHVRDKGCASRAVNDATAAYDEVESLRGRVSILEDGNRRR
jgi:hypothetical protein